MLPGMSGIVYLNGRWLPEEEATIGVQDRGFLFADGVYEVVRYYNGRPLAMDAHVRRMHESLGRVRIGLPGDHPPLDRLSDELVRRNGLEDAAAYWQVTRGVAPRRHPFPPPGTPPTVLMIAYPARPLDSAAGTPALQAITRPDVRWHHCSIKSIALLPNVLDAQAAAEAGCQAAILIRGVRDGVGGDVVSEGASRSIFIVENGELVTHPLDGRILGSITRRIVIELAEEAGIPVRETYYDPGRLFEADEVIAVGSTSEVAAVTHVDGRKIGSGAAGPIAAQLFELYKQRVADHCGRGDE